MKLQYLCICWKYVCSYATSNSFEEQSERNVALFLSAVVISVNAGFVCACELGTISQLCPGLGNIVLSDTIELFKYVIYLLFFIGAIYLLSSWLAYICMWWAMRVWASMTRHHFSHSSLARFCMHLFLWCNIILFIVYYFFLPCTYLLTAWRRGQDKYKIRYYPGLVMSVNK